MKYKDTNQYMIYLSINKHFKNQKYFKLIKLTKIIIDFN